MSDECSEPAGTIQAIDRHSVHQICSGQVVLSLATAVKELLENSIDAGATNIDIRLKEGGVELVEVSDNGRGVAEADFEGLALKHHTSKLSDFSDLVHVETFGFRGEALSSLCALSDLSVVTCHQGALVGSRLEFDHHGRVSSRCPHSRQQGTTVRLGRLFHTLPVRHKEFQRNVKKEFTKMVHILQAYGVIATGVRVTCSNQTGAGGQRGRSSVLTTSGGGGGIRENIAAVFGAKQLHTLLAFQQLNASDDVKDDFGLANAELPQELFTITGFISSIDHGEGRSSTDRQFYFINKRPCDLSKVSKLVNEVYRTYNRQQYPFVALDIAVASGGVDVNVTPDKRQVFLHEEKLLLAILKTSLAAMFDSGVGKIRLNPTSSSSTSSTLGLHHTSSTLGLKRPLIGLLEAGEEDQLRPSLSLARLRAAFSSPAHPGPQEAPGGEGSKQKTLRSFFKGEEGRGRSVATRSPEEPSAPPPSAPEGPERASETEEGSPESKRARTEDRPSSSGPRPEASEAPRPEANAAPPRPEVNVAPPRPEANVAPPRPEAEANAAPPRPEANAAPPRPEANVATPRTETNAPPPRTEANAALRPEASEDPQLLSGLDAPIIAVQKRKSEPLRFSLAELTGRLRRLREQAQEQEEVRYRRFRAQIRPGDNQSAEEELRKEISKDAFKAMRVVGQFNLGFIVARLNSDLFIIDQHAADEKYNFETLQRQTTLQGQKLIAPQKLHLTAVAENVLMENIGIFQKNGFEFVIDEDAPATERVRLASLPASKRWTFGATDVDELVFMLSDAPGVMCRPSRVRQMFASRACRKSVMIGTALSASEMRKMVCHMSELEQPWNCPHGRPTMRHLVNLELLAQR